MTTLSKDGKSFFYPVLAAVAMITPILVVVAASTILDGVERGDFMVSGFGLTLATLAAALVLRAVYTLGFSRAVSDLQTRSRMTRVNA